MHYILKNKTPVKCDNIIEWGKWYEKISNRRVKENYATIKCDAKNTTIEIRVSTVFLAINHNWTNQGEPILFETMVFGGSLNETQDRCCTWQDAEKMHKLWWQKVKLKYKDRIVLSF